MNVSSVKNLNGQSFSAVQDADLTTVVQTNSSNWNDISAYQNASSTYLTAVDLTPYQTVEGMTAYQPAGDYATTADLAEKQDSLTFGYDEQDRINSINSSALAGGGDVPTGTMNVSGLEYNAVNEISAYNGSAIAQYGAEKQWLVHDDTLVHAANSAQYALGVNLSAVAQLLGVDETVLFENINGQKNFTTLEPLTNFNEINFYLNSNSHSPVIKTTVPMYGRNISELHLFFSDIYAGDWKRIDWHWYYSNTGMSSFNYTSGYYKGIQGQGNWDNGEWPANAECYIYKVIGIGRKQ